MHIIRHPLCCSGQLLSSAIELSHWARPLSSAIEQWSWQILVPWICCYIPWWPHSCRGTMPDWLGGWFPAAVWRIYRKEDGNGLAPLLHPCRVLRSCQSTQSIPLTSLMTVTMWSRVQVLIPILLSSGRASGTTIRKSTHTFLQSLGCARMQSRAGSWSISYEE